MNLRQHSKEGQDIVLYHWIRTVGETNRVAVEFGARDGFEGSNVRMFAQLGRYDPDRKWTGDAAFGASFTAMNDLARRKGYVYVDEVGHDLVFVRESLLLPKAVNPTLPRRIHGQTGYDQFTAPTRQIKL